MEQKPLARLRPNHSRTSSGKKIDTWQVDFPGDRAEIDVFMHLKGDETLFSAKSSHPALKGLTWEGTDLNHMRKQATADVERSGKAYYGSGWVPAICARVNLSYQDDPGKRRTTLDITHEPLLRDPETPVGNMGETRVMDGANIGVIFQRRHDQEFPEGKSLSKADFALRNEAQFTRSQALIEEEMAQELDDIHQVIRRFSQELMDRMAPDGIRHEGVPTKEDLALMLRRAIDRTDEINEELPEHGIRV